MTQLLPGARQHALASPNPLRVSFHLVCDSGHAYDRAHFMITCFQLILSALENS